jgi:hypothetical protein
MKERRWRVRLSAALIALACAWQATAAVGGEELAVNIASLDADE